MSANFRPVQIEFDPAIEPPGSLSVTTAVFTMFEPDQDRAAGHGGQGDGGGWLA